MGMTIDEFEEYAKTHNILIMTKDFYENRLKADMVAMLTEIQLEFEELEPEYDCNSYSCGIADCYRTIQEKITSLKEAT